MKTMKRSILFILLALLTGLVGSVSAVTFTITPTAISNTYTGTITLQISGLTNTETVVVQKFLDANTNGVVDAGDILWQQFQLTDGSASVFHNGGTAVTNFNVPGDVDGAANGSITAKLYPSFDFSQLIVGKYLFKLYSPVGHFSPITNSFSVTNFPFAQTITGNVVSNGVPIPNAVVILFQPSDGGQNPQGGVVANNSGAYLIKGPTGAYQLGAVKSNFVANLAVSPYVTLGTGATIITNVPVTGATQSISGNVIDVNNSNLGLAGFLVPVQSPDNLLALAFTDTNGNFTARVTPDQWKINSNGKTLAFKGYLALQNSTKVDTTAGSVSGVTIAVPKATAVFYGTVKDNLGNPLPGVAIYSSDNNGNYETDGYSDTTGNYVAGAIGGLNNDQWQASYDSSSFTSYVFSGGSGNVTLSSGQAYRQNFTALLATNHISGNVQFNGNPVSGVGVNANATINGAGYQPGTAHTDTNGNYSLNVANGYIWSVSLNCNGGSDSLDNILGNGNYQCPNNQNVSINNNNGTANFTIPPANGGQIFGYVTDNVGDPVGSVAVHADDGVGDIYSGTTDGTGYYSINVGNGNYTVSVDCTGLTSLGFQCPGSQPVSVSSDSIEQDFTVLPIPPGGQIFGYVTDNVGNPVGGVAVHADDGIGDIYSGTTDGTGLYSINVGGGNWTVSVDCSGLTSQGFHCPGSQPVVVSGGSIEQDFAVQPITPPNYPFNTLYGFSLVNANANSVYTNFDGAAPYGGLVLFGNTLYGTTPVGGTNGNGTVFGINTSLAGFTNLHFFTATAGSLSTNSDGASPQASLILSGNTLYGTAASGGTNGNGTVFKVNTNGTGFTTLHVFTATRTNSAGVFTNSDGASPQASLVLSGNTLYGTAYLGGINGNGTIFALNTNGTGFTVLHAFTATSTNSAGFSTNNDGAYPVAGLLLSASTLYGPAARGGTNGNGTIFTVNTNGAGFSILHTFTALDPFSGTNDDGANPVGGLILSGNTLYGTANQGGISFYGTVFSMNTNGSGLTVLHHFTGGDDGSDPNAGLVLSSNILYGTATSSGSDGYGTVFGVSTNGTNFRVLHGFTNGSDGGNPYAALVLSGNLLYGTASSGGNAGSGTVFSLSLVPVSASPQLTINLAGTNAILTWPADATGFTLQSAPTVTGTFTNISGATSPYTNPISGTQKFYRLSQ